MGVVHAGTHFYDAADLPFAVVEAGGDLGERSRGGVFLNVLEEGGKLPFPVQISRPGKLGCLFVAPQKQKEKGAHESVDHLGTVGEFLGQFLLHAGQKIFQFSVPGGIEPEVGGGSSLMQRLAEEDRHQILGVELVPEDTFKGAGPDQGGHQHPVISVAGRGVEGAGGGDQHGTGMADHSFPRKMDRALPGEDIVEFKAVGGVPVGRHIAHHAVQGDIFFLREVAGFILLAEAGGKGFFQSSWSRWRRICGGEQYSGNGGFHGVARGRQRTLSDYQPEDVGGEFLRCQYFVPKIRP